METTLGSYWYEKNFETIKGDSTRSCIASDVVAMHYCVAGDVSHRYNVASNTASSRISLKPILPSIQIHAPGSGALVVALIVGIFHGAFGEASGLVASLPYFETILVPK